MKQIFTFFLILMSGLVMAQNAEIRDLTANESEMLDQARAWAAGLNKKYAGEKDVSELEPSDLDLIFNILV